MYEIREYVHLDGWTEEEKRLRKLEQNRRAVQRYRDRNREKVNEQARLRYAKKKQKEI